MGAVFFVGAVVICSIIGFILLVIGLGFFGIVIYRRFKEKKIKLFATLGTVFVISAVAFFLIPIGTIGLFVAMNKDAFEEIGYVIDEKCYQDEKITANGIEYVALDYESGYSGGEAVFTYNYEKLNWITAGYYYKVKDDTLPFDLYYAPQGDLFCKKDDYDKVVEYFENADLIWTVDDKTATNEDELLLSNLNKLKDEGNSINVSSSDISGSVINVISTSSDRCVTVSRYQIYEYDSNYYIYLDYFFEGGNDYYKLLPIPVTVYDALNVPQE